MPPTRYSLSECRAIVRYTEEGQWLTIGGHAEGAAKHVGGFRVLIDSEGRILKGGPKELAGRKVSEAHDFFKAMREEKSESPLASPVPHGTISPVEETKPALEKPMNATETTKLPDLKGSEKQIAYAEKVRRNTLEYFDEEISRLEEQMQDTTETGRRRGEAILSLLRDARAAISSSDKASLYLDLKGANPKQVALALYGESGDRVGREFGARDQARKAGLKIEPRLTHWQHVNLNAYGFFDPDEKEDPKKVAKA